MAKQWGGGVNNYDGLALSCKRGERVWTFPNLIGLAFAPFPIASISGHPSWFQDSVVLNV